MQGLSKQRALESLRARIETIEKRPPLADAAGGTIGASEGLFVLPPGLLHEVFTDTQRNGGAALGFALATARGLVTAARPAILILQLSRDTQDMGLPYGAGLSSFGIDPQSVVLGRMETATDLLWAIEEAIACRAVAAVIAEVAHETKVLDFTASRRLTLRATAGGASVFLLRYGEEREASAARLRWRVEPALSGETMFDARAPSHPRWRVELEKGRLGSRRDPVEWMLDWSENGFVLVEPGGRQQAAADAAGAPLPGALPAALGNRLSEAG